MDTITAGYDYENEKYFISFDPIYKRMYAVMVRLNDEWVPRKIYSGKGTSEKVRSRAAKFCKWCRQVYPRLSFKVSIEWELVPDKEREVIYYEKIEEIVEEIWDRCGRDIWMGVGNSEFYCQVPEHKEEFGKVLRRVGKEKVIIEIRPAAKVRPR